MVGCVLLQGSEQDQVAAVAAAIREGVVVVNEKSENRDQQYESPSEWPASNTTKL